MAIIQRRVFYAKAGAAEEVVGLLQEGIQLFRKRGVSVPFRVLTDYMSGRTDRVVEEVEANNLGEIEAAMGQLMADPQFLADHAALEKRLLEIVHYSEVEHWTVRMSQ